MPAFTKVSMNISDTVFAMFLTSPSNIGSLKHKPRLDRHVCPAPWMLFGSKQAQVGFEGRLGVTEGGPPPQKGMGFLALLLNAENECVECCGIPLNPKYGLTAISCSGQWRWRTSCGFLYGKPHTWLRWWRDVGNPGPLRSGRQFCMGTRKFIPKQSCHPTTRMR